MSQYDEAAFIVAALRKHHRITIIEITKADREWLTEAKPEDRWAVVIAEGEKFSYAPVLEEAVRLADERASV